MFVEVILGFRDVRCGACIFTGYRQAGSCDRKDGTFRDICAFEDLHTVNGLKKKTSRVCAEETLSILQTPQLALISWRTDYITNCIQGGCEGVIKGLNWIEDGKVSQKIATRTF